MKKPISLSIFRSVDRALYVDLPVLEGTPASFFLLLMHLLNFRYLFPFPLRFVAPESAGHNPHDVPVDMFLSRADYSADLVSSLGLSSEDNVFESINREIQSPNTGNTAPPDLVEGVIPSGGQSESETILLAGKSKKDAPTPTSFGLPVRQNPNVPEEVWDAYAGYPQPSDLPDLHIPNTNIQATNKGAVPKRKGALFLPLG